MPRGYMVKDVSGRAGFRFLQQSGATCAKPDSYSAILDNDTL